MHLLDSAEVDCACLSYDLYGNMMGDITCEPLLRVSLDLADQG